MEWTAKPQGFRVWGKTLNLNQPHEPETYPMQKSAQKHYNDASTRSYDTHMEISSNRGALRTHGYMGITRGFGVSLFGIAWYFVPRNPKHFIWDLLKLSGLGSLSRNLIGFHMPCYCKRVQVPPPPPPPPPPTKRVASQKDAIRLSNSAPKLIAES